MASHGARRAVEMEEVADTLRELGVEPLMTGATVALEIGTVARKSATADLRWLASRAPQGDGTESALRRLPHFFRGGIWMNSASCSVVSGFSRNFSFTASR